MPLVRIDLARGQSEDRQRLYGDVVYDAMRSTLNVPENDRFQVITDHPAGGLIADPTYLGIDRSPDCVLIQVTLNAGRTTEMKQAFYKAVADGLHARLGLRREDVVINLVEVAKENCPSATASPNMPDLGEGADGIIISMARPRARRRPQASRPAAGHGRDVNGLRQSRHSRLGMARNGGQGPAHTLAKSTIAP